MSYSQNKIIKNSLEMMSFELSIGGIRGLIEKSDINSFSSNNQRENLNKLIHTFSKLDKDLLSLSYYAYFHNLAEPYVLFNEGSFEDFAPTSYLFLKEHITSCKFLLFVVKNQHILNKNMQKSNELNQENQSFDIEFFTLDFLNNVFCKELNSNSDLNLFFNAAKVFFDDEKDIHKALKLLGYAILFDLIAYSDLEKCHYLFNTIQSLIRFSEFE